jgi:hypothetical protein
VPQPRARRLTVTVKDCPSGGRFFLSPHAQTIKEHSLCDTDEVIEIVLLDALNSVTTTSNCVTATGTRAFARFAQQSAPSHAIT